MQVRPMTPADLDALDEIDATVESRDYLHLARDGEGLASVWKLEQRPLREKLIEPNRVSDEVRFAYKQIARGIEEGAALALDAAGEPVAAAVAVSRPERKLLELVDLRVDYDRRRQGFAMAMLFNLVGVARERELRAIRAAVPANNGPAHELFARVGFDLCGFDERRLTNHDLVKEAATLLWYLSVED